jgi:hypothetical protein
VIEVGFEMRQQWVLTSAHESSGVWQRREIGGFLAIAEIVGLAGDYVTYTTPGIFYVPSVTWDDVQMKVGHSLTCGFTNIDTNVEAVRIVLSENGLPEDISGG